MQKQHFEIEIKAPVEKVWDTMLQDATYRQWTEPFSPGGYFKGSWEEGEKILFVGADPETGKEGGMVSRIKENRPHEFLSIEHQGIVKDGIEDTTSDEAKKWAPAFENYTFEEKDGSTLLKIDVDTADEFVKDFEGMWPKALQKLKELSETP